MVRGSYNSSITRVRPVFGQLIRRDPSGATWLPPILRTVSAGQLEPDLVESPGDIHSYLFETRTYVDSVLARHGVLAIELERCFEKILPPPRAFLEWLIRNPDFLSWPLRGDVETRYGAATQVKREHLFGRGTREAAVQVQLEALNQLRELGPSESQRKWWAFEGFTEVDCYLETDRLLLVIEGKRTEGLSRSTDWYPQRNQLARNLEVANELAGDRKAAAVLLVVESDDFDASLDAVQRGLPHLSTEDLDLVIGRLLGPMTWRALCQATSLDFSTLPDTTESLVASLGAGA